MNKTEKENLEPVIRYMATDLLDRSDDEVTEELLEQIRGIVYPMMEESLKESECDDKKKKVKPSDGKCKNEHCKCDHQMSECGYDKEQPTFALRNYHTFGKRSGDLSQETVISEDEGVFEIEIPAPGGNKDDFNIEMYDNILRVAYTKTKCHQGYNLNNFIQVIKLPPVDLKSVENKYENGVLWIGFDKLPKPVSPRNIHTK